MQFPWINTVRRESDLVEHICRHGVGHPAFGSVHWLAIHNFRGLGVHGCDGCCQDHEWMLMDAQEGCEIANKLLMESVERGKKKHDPPS